MGLQLEAGIEIDLLIAELLMEWPRIDDETPFRTVKECGGCIVNGTPEKFPEIGGIPKKWNPSIRLDHAIDVAEKLRERGWLVIMKWMPKEFYFRIGGGMVSEYDHRPQPEPENILKGKTVVDLEWMRTDDWPYMPVPKIISADTPSLAFSISFR